MQHSAVYRPDTTVAAIATPQGTGGIAVIRLSGPDAVAIAQKLCPNDNLAAIEPRRATLVTLTDSDGATLDRPLLTLFRAPASFTGEDTVEFAVHGSQHIQRALLRSLFKAGAVAAAPGEFTQRAFLNGRLDLAQAEAIADLIAARSQAAHRLALRQAAGQLSHHLDTLRQKLIDLAAMLELELDFAEEDVEFADRTQLLQLTDTLAREIERLTDTYADGKAFRDGIPVAIIGAPNAGKSTLLNALLDEEKAIVSDIPGTTRDVISDTRQINGLLFRFIDTAGIHHTDDAIEKIGISRALGEARRAAIILRLTAADAGSPTPLPDDGLNPDATVIDILTKSDLLPDDTACGEGGTACGALRISALTGEGISLLHKQLTDAALGEKHDLEHDIILTNERHYSELTAAHAALARVRTAITDGISADFIAQDLRLVTQHLAQVTGAVTNTELLHTIFSRFCIGK